MRFAMCNEFCQGWSHQDTFRLAAETGFEGVELAPFTLAATPGDFDAQQRRGLRDLAQRHQLTIVGLHWLLARTTGLHIASSDAGVQGRTLDYYRQLIDLCADLGGDRMIHGSPAQRNLAPEDAPEGHFQCAVEFFSAMAPAAAERGVTLCVEPLGRADTNFLTTKDQAIRLIRAVNHPSVRLILDCKAMADEDKPIPQIIREARADLVHFHANDKNLSYPGSGEMDFTPIMGALREVGYDGWVSIEVFDFNPPPEVIAREGLRCLEQSLSAASAKSATVR